MDSRCQVMSTNLDLEDTTMVMVETSSGVVQSAHLESRTDETVVCACSVYLLPLVTLNGTRVVQEEWLDLDISCEMHATVCPKSQQLYSL